MLDSETMYFTRDNYIIKCLLSLASFTGWHTPDDVRISRVGDGHGAYSEVFTTSCAQLNVVACVVVNSSLGQHGIVFNLRFPA